MKNRRTLGAGIGLLFCPLGLCLLGGCSRGAEEAEPTATATIEVQRAAEQAVAQTLIAYGTVEFMPARTRALTVQVESQLAERFVLPGTTVRQGQPLVRLVPSAASRLDVDKAARDASVALAEAQRVERLHAQGLATDSELRSAQAASDTAMALRDSLTARIGSARAGSGTAPDRAQQGITLTAPIAGVVDSLTAQPGDVIPAGTLLLRVADPNAVYARLGIEPAEAAQVHAGQAVELTELFPQAQPLQGILTEIDSRVDPQTRLTMAVARPATPAALVPGSSVRARIVIATREHALTVPRSAVLYQDEEPYLFVDSAGKAVRRSITTGVKDGDRIEVTRGLEAGESVVTGGNYELEDGMAVTVATAPANAPKSPPGKS